MAGVHPAGAAELFHESRVNNGIKRTQLAETELGVPYACYRRHLLNRRLMVASK